MRARAAAPWDLPAACALTVAGVGMIIGGAAAVWTTSTLSYLVIVVVGIIVAALGERIILHHPAMASQQSRSHPIGQGATSSGLASRKTARFILRLAVEGVIVGGIAFVVVFAILAFLGDTVAMMT